MQIKVQILLRELIEKWKILFIIPIIFSIIAYIYSSNLPTIFTAKTSILQPKQSKSLGSLSGAFGGLGLPSLLGNDSSAEEILFYLSSNNIKDRIIKNLKLDNKLKSIKNARDYLEEREKFYVKKNSKIIFIEFSDKDPDFAIEISNEYVNALSELYSELKYNESRFAELNLQSKINQIYSQKFNSVLVRDFIIQSTLREYEIHRYAEFEKQFVQQIDKAEAKKTGPNSFKFTLISFLFSFIFTIILILLRYYFQNIKKILNTN